MARLNSSLMYKSQSFQNCNSYTFSEMANHDLYTKLSYLFGGEQQQRVRKFLVICRERLTNTFSPYEHSRAVLSGSTSDGVAYPRSDDDTMFSDTSPDLLVRSSVEEAVQYNAPLMIPSDTSPGYCLLLIPNVDRHWCGRFCVNNYLSSFAWKNNFLQPWTVLHGPCESGFIGKLEFDFAFCLTSHHWPDIAVEWIHRERRFGWPSRSVVEQIISNGCHVVAIGDPDSSMVQHQWRVSFSLAERTLVHTFNHTQFLIYNILKLVLKRIINVQEPDCMCSYFIKTTMFYCIENTESSLWDKEQLERCYSKCLSQLLAFVDEMFCPNYFVKSNNMFKRKINSTNRPRLLSLLQWILQLGIPGVLDHMEERWIVDIPISTIISEGKRDLEIFRGYLFELLIYQIWYVVFSFPYNTRVFESVIQIIVGTASECLTSGEEHGFTLLLLRLSWTLIAGKLEIVSRQQVLNQKLLYKMRKSIEKFFQRGIQYDVSCGRLRYATHLYTVNEVDKCLTMIQKALSAMSPYVLTMYSRVDDDLLNMYQQMICGRNLSIAEKFQQAFAHVVFYSSEHSILPAPVSLLMCQGETVGCNANLYIDPVAYAYVLQGLCFVKLQKQTGLRNSMAMLKDRLENNSYIVSAVYEQLSFGYSLLGRLELLQGRLPEAVNYFVKSYLFREQRKKSRADLQTEKINYTLLNLGIACRHLFNQI